MGAHTVRNGTAAVTGAGDRSTRNDPVRVRLARDGAGIALVLLVTSRRAGASASRAAAMGGPKTSTPS